MATPPPPPPSPPPSVENEPPNWIIEHRRTNLMVVATLLASVALQVVLNPPGGVWQEDNFLLSSSGEMIDPVGKPVNHPVDANNKTVTVPHQAGFSVLARNHPELAADMLNINRICFGTSIFIIILLMGNFNPTNVFYVGVVETLAFAALCSAVMLYDHAAHLASPNPVGQKIDIWIRSWMKVAAYLSCAVAAIARRIISKHEGRLSDWWGRLKKTASDWWENYAIYIVAVSVIIFIIIGAIVLFTVPGTESEFNRGEYCARRREYCERHLKYGQEY